MTDDAPSLPTFHLHFEGEATHGHAVPASALVQAAQALQRAIHVLAFAHEGHGIKERLRIGAELDRKYSVIFKVPEDGGYDLPYVIGNAARTLFDPADIQTVTTQHLASLEAVQRRDLQALKRIIPHAAIRRQYLTALKNVQPPTRTGIIVSIEDHQKTKLLDGRVATASLVPMLAEPHAPSVQPRVVTGRLDVLDFQAHRLTLALFTGRHLDCAYGEDFETALVENRREWIQIRGEAVLNDDDTLKALNNVTEILEIDESPLQVQDFDSSGLAFRLKRPLSMDVNFDPQDGLYMVECDYFNLMLTAETRVELEVSVSQAFGFVWNEFVLADPTDFTEDALTLRQRLIDTFGNADES